MQVHFDELAIPVEWKLNAKMPDTMSFLIFGDQSLDTYGSLSEFCRRGSPSVLATAFLGGVCVALNVEISQLSSIERRDIPSFSSIQQLNERYKVQPYRNSAIDSALLCITQLAHYIE